MSARPESQSSRGPLSAQPSASAMLGDQVYSALVDQIVRLDLLPGTKLSESELASQLGVGLAPVRAAVRRLESEKLVVIVPRSGTVVQPINLRMSRSILEARLPLEDLAARLAVRRGTRKEKERLLDIAVKQRDSERLDDKLDLDVLFHSTVYELTRNEFLIPTLRMYLNHSLRLWHYVSRILESENWTTVDSVAMAESMLAGDEDQAAAKLTEHVGHDGQEIINLLGEHGL
ncbi:MAG: GntR family transcriptional regulator [Leucobacter sp.]